MQRVLFLLGGLLASAAALAPQPRRAPTTMSASKPAMRGWAGAPSEWHRDYQGFVASSGFQVCGAAWEGYRKLGRGAMFVSCEDGGCTHAPVIGACSEGREMFIPAGRLSADADGVDMAAIMDSVGSYDPDSELVVLFENKAGVLGFDVLRPHLPLPQIARSQVYRQKKLKRQEEQA
mmetsp:Transcript_43867/g.137845  ORF Transcript_43867/g.137845 Transcript_43867/m.137845 type:complete len:177 (+) Transcript_43867:250-780(+)